VPEAANFNDLSWLSFMHVTHSVHCEDGMTIMGVH